MIRIHRERGYPFFTLTLPLVLIGEDQTTLLISYNNKEKMDYWCRTRFERKQKTVKNYQCWKISNEFNDGESKPSLMIQGELYDMSDEDAHKTIAEFKEFILSGKIG